MWEVQEVVVGVQGSFGLGVVMIYISDTVLGCYLN